MGKNYIVEQIVEYVMENRFDRAIMLYGACGAGKTYFVKNILIPVLREKCKKSTIYMSLKGVADKEHLKKDIFIQNFLSKFIYNINISPKRIHNIILLVRTVSKVLLQIISMISILPNYCIILLKKLINIDTKNGNAGIELINDFILKNCVIIFDDMECCDLSCDDLYGIVKNLLEKSGIKVIIIANQEVMENTEKIIGLSIAFRVVLSEVYEDVINKIIKHKEVRQYLLEKQDMVIEIFSEKTCYNVGILILALIAFEKFFMIIKETYSCNHLDGEFCDTWSDCKIYAGYLEKEYENVLKYTVYDKINIEITRKSIADKVLNGDLSSNYGVFCPKCAFYYRFVDDYLLSYKLDQDNIKAVVWEKIQERKKWDESIVREEELAYQKLENWKMLEDNVVQERLIELLEELREGKYSPTYFRGIVLRLIHMKINGVKIPACSAYVDCMKKILMAYKGDLCIDDFTVSSSICGAKIKRCYDRVMSDIFKMFTSEPPSVENYFKKDYWNEDYVNMCKRGISYFIEKGKFLSYMDQEKFFKELQSAKATEIDNFIAGVNVIYNVSDLRVLKKIEAEVVGELVKKLDELKINSKTRTLAIKALVDKLKRINELLSPNVLYNRN